MLSRVCVCAQLCPTLCNTMDCSLPGSSVYRTFQARILKLVAISYSRGSSRPRDWTHVSCISCIGRQILNYWVAWEALSIYTSLIFYLFGLIIIERSMLQVCFMMVNLSISPWSSFSFGMDLKLFICFFKKSIYWEKIQIYRKAGRIINIHHLDSTLDTFLSCFHFFKKMNYNIVSFYPRHFCMNL